MKRCSVCKIEKDVMFYVDIYKIVDEEEKELTYHFCSKNCIRLASKMANGELKERILEIFPEVKDAGI